MVWKGFKVVRGRGDVDGVIRVLFLFINEIKEIVGKRVSRVKGLCIVRFGFFGFYLNYFFRRLVMFVLCRIVFLYDILCYRGNIGIERKKKRKYIV